MIAYMAGEEAVAMIIFFGFVTVIVWLSQRHSARMARLKTIQKAIDAGNLDESTRRTILDAMAADSRGRDDFWRRLVSGWGTLLTRLVFVVGWGALMIGGILLLGMRLTGNQHPSDQYGCVIAIAVGFAAVTLPIAMRELDARRAAARP